MPSIFSAGSIVGHMRLNVGAWNRNVQSVMRDTVRIRSSLRMMTRDMVAMGRTMGWAGAAGIYFGRRIAGSFLEAASTVEQYRGVLKVMLKDQSKVNDLFGYLVDTARKVPQEFKDVLNTGTLLSVVLKGNADDVKKWTPMILDLASVIQALGINLQETTGQFSRLYSAGLGAVDLFRDRGVLQILGFDPKEALKGVPLSEVRRRLWEAWTKDDSLFRGAVEKMAQTWVGQVSMMQDSWFLFRDAVMNDTGMFPKLKNLLSALNGTIQDNWDSIRAWLSANGALVESIVLWTAAIVAGTAALAVFFGVLVPIVTTIGSGLVGAFSLLTTPIGIAVAALAMFGAGVYTVRAVIIKFAREHQFIWKVISTVVSTTLKTIVSNAKTAVIAVYEAFKWLMNKLIGLAAVAMAKIAKGFQVGWNGIKDILQVMSSPSGFMEKLEVLLFADPATAVTVAFDDARKAMQEWRIDSNEMLSEDYVGQAAAAVGGPLVESINWATEEVADLGETVKNQFNDDMGSIQEALKQQFPLATKMIDDFYAYLDGRKKLSLNPAAVGEPPTFGGMEEEEMSASAKKAIERALEEAKDVRLKLYPQEQLAEDIKNIVALASKFPAILTPEVVKKSFAGLATEFRKNAIDEFTDPYVDLTESLSAIPQNYVTMFNSAKDEAYELALTLESVKDQEFEISRALSDGISAIEGITGPYNTAKSMQTTLSQVTYALPQLIASGRLTEADSRSILNDMYWDQLSMAASMTIEEIARAMQTPGLSVEILGALNKALKDKVIESLQDMPSVIESIGSSMDEAFGGSVASKVTRTFASLSRGVLGIIDMLKEAPALFKAMAAAGASTAAKIAVAMHMALNVIALIADAVAAVISLFSDMGDSGEKELKGIKKVIQDIKELSEQWMDGLIDSLIDFARTGETTFKELMDSMLEDLFRVATTELILQPIVNLIGSALPGFAKGAAFKDGIVKSPTVISTKSGPAQIGEAGPEVVAPLKRMGNGELGIGAVPGGKTEVHLHTTDIPSDLIHVSSSRGSDGTEQIEIVVDSVVKKLITTGRLDKVMGIRWGMHRRPV